MEGGSPSRNEFFALLDLRRIPALGFRRGQSRKLVINLKILHYGTDPNGTKLSPKPTYPPA
jgi:hypothetical protein